jgi:hypothetical protein
VDGSREAGIKKYCRVKGRRDITLKELIERAEKGERNTGEKE